MMETQNVLDHSPMPFGRQRHAQTDNILLSLIGFVYKHIEHAVAMDLQMLRIFQCYGSDAVYDIGCIIKVLFTLENHDGRTKMMAQQIHGTFGVDYSTKA